MKLKQLFNFALFCFCVLIIQSCTSDLTSNEENNIDENDAASIEIENEDIEILPAADYCKYRVKTSTKPGKIAIGTGVCFKCVKRVGCGLNMNTTITVGDDEVTVTGGRIAGTCVTCNPKKDIILG